MSHNTTVAGFKILALVGLLATLSENDLRANTISYSWSGLAESRDGADPWNLGIASRPFSVEFVLDNSQSPQIDGNGKTHIYETQAVNIAVEGVGTLISSSAHVIFMDDDQQLFNWLGSRDEVLLSVDAKGGSHIEPLIIAAVLPDTTFNLAQPTLPNFASATVTDVVRISYTATSYLFLSPAGTQVTSQEIPEPLSSHLALMAAVAFNWCRRRADSQTPDALLTEPRRRAAKKL